MVHAPGRDKACVPQRSIYDERYLGDQYDRRSVVRVLMAERAALDGAVDRALKSNPHVETISLFDFGYGTGRVTNELIERYFLQFGAWRKDLRVIAYDVSSTGLKKAHAALCATGFETVGQLAWAPESAVSYIAGSVYKEEAGAAITVVFVHACEYESPETMTQLALKTNNGQPFLLITSWYSGLGHVPHKGLRREYFCQLSKLAHPQGEIVLALSSTGDLVDEQREWSEKLAKGTVGNFPIEEMGDVVYQTELGQSNFYHVFGTELNDLMKSITSMDQHWWVEGIRCPDEEFASEEAERANYQRVREANERKRGRAWTADDYRQFHTVAVFRSPMDPMKR